MPNRQSQQEMSLGQLSNSFLIDQSFNRMSKANTENGMGKRHRVSRACDICRLKKAKCDSSLPCSTCVQRDIPCIRRNGRKHPPKPQEFHDKLIKAVHALYQASKGNSDMTEVGDITTHAILESLDLIKQADPDLEASLKYPSPEDTRSPSTSTNSSPCPVSTNSEGLSRSDSMSSISHQITGSSGSLPSPKSVDCMVGLQTASMEASSITRPSWQSLPTAISANDFDYFELPHAMPPLFGTDFPAEARLLSGTGMTNAAPTVPRYDDTTSATFNNFPLYHESIGEIRPLEQGRPDQGDFGFDPASPLPKHSLVKTGDVEMMDKGHGFEKHADQGDFGFDPVSPPSKHSLVKMGDAEMVDKGHGFEKHADQGDFGIDPASPLPKHSLVKMGDIEMMKKWNGFEKHADQGDFGFDPVSPPSKRSLVKMGDVEMMNKGHGFDKHAEHGNLGNPPAGLQSSTCTSTLSEAHSWEGGDPSTTNLSFRSGTVSPKELAPTTTSEHFSPTLPRVRKKGRPRLEELDDSPYFGHASAGSAHKRSRKWSGDSTSAGPQSSEIEKRRISLEKNRRAAAKCREKKRSEIHQLEEASRATAAENSLLKQQTKQMREEILNLRSKFLTHVSDSGCRRPEEVRMVLDDRLDGISLNRLLAGSGGELVS